MQPQKKPSGNSHLVRLKEGMEHLIIGQDRALSLLMEAISKSAAGLADPDRPMMTAMFLGPTGVGKTETVAALAEMLFGNRRAFTRVNCQEYSAHYNISKLLGSPPGYVGGEIRPLLSQENIDRHHRKAIDNQSGLVAEPDGNLFEYKDEEEEYISIILFDEIEKGHPKLWNLLLGILEEGTVVLGNNEEVDFRRSIIIVTTNVGSSAMMHEFSNQGMGFSVSRSQKRTFERVLAAAKREVHNYFPMEFINRFDELVYFNALDRDSLRKIFDVLMTKIHYRGLVCKASCLIEMTDNAKEHLLDIGTDVAFGARPLRRVLEKEVVTVIARYVCSDDIAQGDLVTVDYDGQNLIFHITDSINKGMMTFGNPYDSTSASKAFQNTDGTSEDIDYADDVAQRVTSGKKTMFATDHGDDGDTDRGRKRRRR